MRKGSSLAIDLTDVTSTSGGGTEEENISQGAAPGQPTEAAAAQAPVEVGAPTQAPPQATAGKRTQLKIVRETIESLSKDINSFRKSSEASVKRLEAQVTSLRKELAVHTRSKDLGEHVKSHESDTKRLEKQIATLRSDLAGLKSHVSKEAAKSRAKEEAALSRVLAKVRPKPSKKPPTKRAKKKR